MNKRVHLLVSTSGGVGKTTISSILKNKVLKDSKLAIIEDTFFKEKNEEEANVTVNYIEKIILHSIEILQEDKAEDVLIDTPHVLLLPLISMIEEYEIIQEYKKSGIKLSIHLIMGGISIREKINELQVLNDVNREILKHFVLWEHNFINYDTDKNYDKEYQDYFGKKNLTVGTQSNSSDILVVSTLFPKKENLIMLSNMIKNNNYKVDTSLSFFRKSHINRFFNYYLSVWKKILLHIEEQSHTQNKEKKEKSNVSQSKKRESLPSSLQEEVKLMKDKDESSDENNEYLIQIIKETIINKIIALVEIENFSDEEIEILEEEYKNKSFMAEIETILKNENKTISIEEIKKHIEENIII